ncbi:hypothetical protein [Flagellimonas sp.]|uniref:hypothetical protein n=1 Tax=Flagellimonas sp. TaxID=2058762 RepID=UPI003B58D25E
MKIKFIITLVFALSYFQCFTQTGDGSEQYQILTYGLQSGIDDAQAIVNQKWNIEIVPVAGCRVTRKLIDSVKTHNIATWKLIETEKKVQNPKLVYKKDIYETRQSLEKIKLLAYENETLNGIWKNLKNKPADYLVFEDPQFISKSKYAVTVKKRKRKMDGKSKHKSYELVVNLSSESLTIKE